MKGIDPAMPKDRGGDKRGRREEGEEEGNRGVVRCGALKEGCLVLFLCFCASDSVPFTIENAYNSSFKSILRDTKLIQRRINMVLK